ncbi:hypothetical protein, partial [Pararhodospirillum oryzae]|uniref:hypothetical protein n=1 Tax=Pararhodospirillum oryzae TaxID=478448 RepID=UPI0014784A4C
RLCGPAWPLLGRAVVARHTELTTALSLAQACVSLLRGAADRAAGDGRADRRLEVTRAALSNLARSCHYGAYTKGVGYGDPALYRLVVGGIPLTHDGVWTGATLDTLTALFGPRLAPAPSVLSQAPSVLLAPEALASAVACLIPLGHLPTDEQIDTCLAGLARGFGLSGALVGEARELLDTRYGSRRAGADAIREVVS